MAKYVGNTFHNTLHSLPVTWPQGKDDHITTVSWPRVIMKKSDFQLTKDTSYLTLTGELWGVFYGSVLVYSCFQFPRRTSFTVGAMGRSLACSSFCAIPSSWLSSWVDLTWTDTLWRCLASDEIKSLKRKVIIMLYFRQENSFFPFLVSSTNEIFNDSKQDTSLIIHIQMIFWFTMEGVFPEANS